MITRREFIAKAGLSLAGASLLQSTFAQATDQPVIFDLHTHPGLFIAKGSPRYGGDDAVLKTINDMNTGKLTGAFFSLVADAPIIKATDTGIVQNGSYAPGDGWKEYKRQLAIVKEFIRTSPVTVATKAADLDAALKNKKVAAYLAIEGGDFLEGHADKLDEMYTDGIRSIQLVHYHVNELGNLQTETPQHDGLSASGKEVVKKMNKLGMLIDVAHAAESTVRAVVDLTDAPIILSHTMLQAPGERPLAKRAISEEHAKLISKNGGVIGAWPSGYNSSFEDFIDGIKRLVDVAGIDHVGLGTDLDGNFKPVMTSFLQLGKWTDALRAKGFREDEVRKVIGGNAQRVLKQVVR